MNERRIVGSLLEQKKAGRLWRKPGERLRAGSAAPYTRQQPRPATFVAVHAPNPFPTHHLPPCRDTSGAWPGRRDLR